MQVRVQKWGNGLAVRIPKSFAIEARIEPDEVVDLSLVDGKLIISPTTRTGVTLEDLLQGVTEENLHGEFETGPAAGAEAW
jgi:antitoxin MazE